MKDWPIALSSALCLPTSSPNERTVPSGSSAVIHAVGTYLSGLTRRWRRLRDIDYYRDDPLVKRALGLRSMPNVSTLTRALRAMDVGVVDRLRKLLCTVAQTGQGFDLHHRLGFAHDSNRQRMVVLRNDVGPRVVDRPWVPMLRLPA